MRHFLYLNAQLAQARQRVIGYADLWKVLFTGAQASSLVIKITDGQAGGEAARRSGWVLLAPRLEARARGRHGQGPAVQRAALASVRSGASCPHVPVSSGGCPGGLGRGSGHRHGKVLDNQALIIQSGPGPGAVNV